MPTPSRWMIRISMLFLLMGMTMGAMMLIQKAYSIHPAIWILLPVHIEVTIFGWIVQFTLGTAYWMLPRFLTGSSRGNSSLAYAMVVLLNTGIIFVIADSLLSFALPLDLIGRLFELAAVGLFVKLHWNRAVTYRNTG